MQSNDGSIKRYTVKEASEVLGISPEAVRARLHRGSLDRDKDEDGTVYVLLRPKHTHSNDDQPNDQSMMLEHLDSEVGYLRAELRHQAERHADETRELRRLIAGLIERVPELPAATPPESPRQWTQNEDRTRHESGEDATQSTSKDAPKVNYHGDQRPFWKRLFG